MRFSVSAETDSALQTMAGKLALLLVAGLLACCTKPVEKAPAASQPGQLVELEDVFGTFYAYVPTAARENPEVLVVIHGTPPRDMTAEENAKLYACSWIDFSEEHGLLLIVPAFNQEDFSSRYGDRAMGGYRGLFGREIGADAWVQRLVRAHQDASGAGERPFLLYGHSAGGQFAARFLVTHPQAVNRAVITAAATYPQPVTAVAWPWGMGRLDAEIEWDAGTTNHVDIAPEEGVWLAATQVPLTVIVGLADTADLPPALLPGQKGRNRLVIARNWVRDMASFAEEHGLESRFEVEIIPGVGHSMSGLLPYSQAALAPE